LNFNESVGKFPRIEEDIRGIFRSRPTQPSFDGTVICSTETLSMRKTLDFILVGAVVLAFGLTYSGAQRSSRRYAVPPRTIVICGIQNRPCVTYNVSYREPANGFGTLPGEGVTDYERKTISLTWSNDRFENVRSLEHEVFHAVLWERGFREDDTWDIHSWIYFSEGAYPLLFHDNPEFVKYVASGY
jgi:hypothetical protein